MADLSLGPFQHVTSDFRHQAQQAVQKGEAYSNSVLRKSITDRVQAYILDKAVEMGANIQVQVILSDDAYPVPEQVCIQGDISPYARNQLKHILEELGVAEENQIWT